MYFRKFKIPGQKVVEVIENGLNSLFPGLCLKISRWKVLVDGFVDGGDSPIR
jgi:hypothetical protein